jgi:hypothetical protein
VQTAASAAAADAAKAVAYERATCPKFRARRMRMDGLSLRTSNNQQIPQGGDGGGEPGTVTVARAESRTLVVVSAGEPFWDRGASAITVDTGAGEQDISADVTARVTVLEGGKGKHKRNATATGGTGEGDAGPMEDPDAVVNDDVYGGAVQGLYRIQYSVGIYPHCPPVTRLVVVLPALPKTAPATTKPLGAEPDSSSDSEADTTALVLVSAASLARVARRERRAERQAEAQLGVFAVDGAHQKQLLGFYRTHNPRADVDAAMRQLRQFGVARLAGMLYRKYGAAPDGWAPPGGFGEAGESAARNQALVQGAMLAGGVDDSGGLWFERALVAAGRALRVAA